MLVVCWDIHVLGSPLMSVVVTRMQDLAFEFSKKISRGWYPGSPQREGAPPSRTHLQPGLWPGAERKRPVLERWNPNLGLLNFSAVVAPLLRDVVREAPIIGKYTSYVEKGFFFFCPRRRLSRGGGGRNFTMTFVCPFFRTVSHKPMQLESPNWTQKCSTMSLETRLFWGQKLKGSGSQKHRRRGSLHSCECWLLLVYKYHDFPVFTLTFTLQGMTQM